MPLFASASPLGPLLVLGICFLCLILAITVFRLHAFFALMLAAVLAGGLAPADSKREGSGRWTQAVEQTTAEWGVVAGKIGLVIALAAVIGMTLVESGAADVVVSRFLRAFGENRAAPAIATSSYLLSMPIFFDTFFMLISPLARAIATRTGKDYVLYILAIVCGGSPTHSLVIPHPGPLAMAENLHLDLGLTAIVGIIAGVPVAFCGWITAKFLNRKIKIPVPALSEAEEKLGNRPPPLSPPGFLAALSPVLLPILLIGSVSVLELLGGAKKFPGLFPVMEFLGNRNVALFVGVLIGTFLVMRARKVSLAQVGRSMAGPLETAGMIILITSAGGAFGAMLRKAGVGEVVHGFAENYRLNLIVLAWFVSALIRVVQGSATVAMITASAMIYTIVEKNPALPYHPVYLFLAIGFGSKMFSWMNDSGFWVVGKLSGFTEKQTLSTWSVVVSVLSLAGLIECLVASTLFPGR